MAGWVRSEYDFQYQDPFTSLYSLLYSWLGPLLGLYYCLKTWGRSINCTRALKRTTQVVHSFQWKSSPHDEKQGLTTTPCSPSQPMPLITTHALIDTETRPSTCITAHCPIITIHSPTSYFWSVYPVIGQSMKFFIVSPSSCWSVRPLPDWYNSIIAGYDKTLFAFGMHDIG